MDRFGQEWEMLLAADSWLSERGYRLVDRRGPEGMNMGIEIRASDRLGIRIAADRGQWFVDVASSPESLDRDGSSHWFGLEAWSVCLGAPALFHDRRPTLTDKDRVVVLANSWWLQPQLDYLREHLAAIEEACSPNNRQATLACLSDAQWTSSAFPTKSAKGSGDIRAR
jgi:hypothetical protein